MKFNALRLKPLIALLMLLTGNLSAQENAKLIGKVTDKDSGEELIGASVVIVGTTIGVKTNIDGEFSLNVKPGKVDLRVSYVGYQTRTVKGIEVKAGQANRVDIQLKAEAAQAEEIVVQAEISNATESALLTQQRKSLAVQDGISAELIKKTPDSDAGEAAKRITGVSLVGGKYVFVRGLGERYSSTQLNGVTIPSPEPEKKVVPLDIIPANLIENIITVKTFLPDQPGTFAGGLVKIRTKEFPDQFTFNVSISGGINTNAHFNARPAYSFGKFDFLGIDDGTRIFPKNFLPPEQSVRQTYTGRTGAREIVSLFGSNIWNPTFNQYAPNQGYSIAIADRIGALPLGYIASLSYSSDVNYKEQRLFFLNPVPNPQSPAIYDFDTQVSTFGVNWGGLLNLNVQLGENNKIGIKNTYNRTAEDEVRIAEGNSIDPEFFNDIRSTRLRFVERQLISSQVTGTHYLSSLGKSEFEWKAQYARASRREPDNRETYFTKVQGDSIFIPGNRNQRFFAELADNAFDAVADWTMPFTQWSGQKSKLKLGGLFSNKSRQFEARRFRYLRLNVGNYDRDFRANGIDSPEAIFSPSAFTDTTEAIEFNEYTRPQDEYQASEQVIAGYIMTELPLTTTLRFIGGVRVEKNKVELNADVGFSFTSPVPINAGFDRTNILPSLNLVWSPIESINLRAGFSQTIAQPELRELAPFQFDDFRSSTYGNPGLKQTVIQNYDIRWEWFPRIGELVAVSFFYKNLQNPLERLVLADQSTLPVFTTINGLSARNFGMEFEIRKRLDVLTPMLSNFSLGMNATLVSSNVEIDPQIEIWNQSEAKITTITAVALARSRPLQGQSPFILNVNLGYQNDESGWQAILLYNISGARISELTGSQFIQENIYEQPRNQLDFSISKRITQRFGIKVNIKNILNDRYLFTFGKSPKGVEAERFKVGTNFSVNVSYTL